jgi:dTDP-4-amino-4,6-dideoxygalactose transaminase
VQELEHRIADMIGVKHCIAICNGTIALEIAIRALGLEGEVIVPAMTFIATAHALQWQEITPVFCDTDPKTHTLDPQQVEKMITPRTTGIIGVHLWGRPCDVLRLTEIAQAYKLKLLFDAAHAFYCSHKGTMIGNFGRAEVFSFHATKFFNTFEGGAVVTNDDELANTIRLMTNFGFAGYDKVIYVGTNGKMNEACAAMGLTNLSNLDKFIEINYRNYQTYKKLFQNLEGVKLLTYNRSDNCNYQYIIIEVDQNIIQVTRDQLVNILHAENILARRYFYPGCHKMEPYRSHFPHSHLLLPQTERTLRRVISLPTGTSITPNQIRIISHIIRLVIENGTEVSDRLSLLPTIASQEMCA